jgi:hypothetical protein
MVVRRRVCVRNDLRYLRKFPLMFADTFLRCVIYRYRSIVDVASLADSQNGTLRIDGHDLFAGCSENAIYCILPASMRGTDHDPRFAAHERDGYRVASNPSVKVHSTDLGERTIDTVATDVAFSTPAPRVIAYLLRAAIATAGRHDAS